MNPLGLQDLGHAGLGDKAHRLAGRHADRLVRDALHHKEQAAARLEGVEQATGGQAAGQQGAEVESEEGVGGLL